MKTNFILFSFPVPWRTRRRSCWGRSCCKHLRNPCPESRCRLQSSSERLQGGLHGQCLSYIRPGFWCQIIEIYTSSFLGANFVTSETGRWFRLFCIQACYVFSQSSYGWKMRFRNGILGFRALQHGFRGESHLKRIHKSDLQFWTRSRLNFIIWMTATS